MNTILVVDDDVYIGNMLEEVLHKEGYGVLRAYSGSEALLLLSSGRPDLVLLDLMLPGLNGEEVLAAIQGIPVIIVSARAEAEDKVSLLLGGAADYVTKPFDMQELLARIAVQFRKTAVIEEEARLHVDDIVLDMAARSVVVNDRAVKVTRTEYAILRLLMRNPDQVIPKSMILEKISGDTPDCVESSLKVHISNLRKKLREAGGKDYIESVWGIGFKMKTLG
ncbi:MAG: response regulator transcription factor [Lachnospiraceae bacterium]|jgi:DNA-binding response OmpR family regulator|nr:response regulator transcription factor [Lachnospiraceae bacterium]